MTILDKIIANKRIEIAAQKEVVSPEELKEICLSARTCNSFKAALQASETGIIAEFKRKSPSKGFIKEGAAVKDIVPGYARSGAAAISVLTDGDFFGGSLDDLREARALLDAEGFTTPLLRKEFIVDEYQLYQAKAYGADLVLLIAAVLTPDETERLAQVAHSLGLEVLLEIHNEAELANICADVDVVGINNRNLATFVTDINTSVSLGEKIPHSFIRISESGISEPETVRALRAEGFRGFLMGENFMKQANPAEALQIFIAQVGK